VIGGFLFAGFGWRSIFWFLTAVGVVLVAAGWKRLPETLPEANRQPFHFRP
jgi:DHA1 family bicyclomycin/chloramphenicol resistance-like MFS transporter